MTMTQHSYWISLLAVVTSKTRERKKFCGCIFAAFPGNLTGGSGWRPADQNLSCSKQSPQEESGYRRETRDGDGRGETLMTVSCSWSRKRGTLCAER